MPLRTFTPGVVVVFDYDNHRGSADTRVVTFHSLQYGSNEYYPDAQWFLHGYCHDRKADRSFALARMTNLEPEG